MGVELGEVVLDMVARCWSTGLAKRLRLKRC